MTTFEIERGRNYLDNIWEFQMAIDLVLEVAKDPDLCLLQWNEFKELVSDLNRLWSSIKHERPLPTAWDWDPATFETTSQPKDQ